MLLGIVLVSFLFSAAALALETGLDYGTFTGLGVQDLRITVMNIIRVVLGFLGVLAIAIIVYAGVVWTTSAGNAEKIELAKRILTSAVIGLIIILLAFAIVSFIINQLIIATGAGPGGGEVSCEPGSCLACNVICNSAGTGGSFDPNSCSGPAYCSLPSYPACPKPGTAVPTVCKIEATRGFGPGGVPQGASGDYATIEGWYFGDYLAGTSRVEFDDTEAEIVQCSAAPVWSQRADGYGLARIQLPNLETSVTYGVTLTNSDNQVSGSKPYTIVAGEPIPSLACIIPPSGLNNQVLNSAEGIRFGPEPNASDQGLIFSASQKAVNYSGWSDILIATPEVPTFAVSGYAEIIDINNLDSNDVWFTVTCTENNDCATNCCANFSCQPASACLPGQGSSCDPNPATTDICEPGGNCQPGLVCGENSCVCELPGAGQNCDVSELPACQPGTCDQGLVCNATGSCTCDEVPIINFVSPDSGAVGNLITIGGRYFGESPGQVHFTDTSGNLTVLAPLASTANAACTDVWTNSQIVVLVPAGAGTGPVKVTRAVSLNGTSDQTNNSRGSNLADFEVNGIVRPGLCQIDPPSGAVGSGINTIEGVRFTAGGVEVYFGSVLAGGSPLVNGSNQITGVSVPNVSLGEVGVRVKDINSNEFSNPLNFTVGESSGSGGFECSSQVGVCDPDSSQCDPGRICNASCECETVPDIDPEGILCDENIGTPQCDVSADNICPDGYACDPASCFCRSAVGAADASTYAWFFNTTTQAPRVVETCTRNASCSPGAISSPTPFNRGGTNSAGYQVSLIRPDDGAVPIDAIISARFTAKMYLPSLTGSNVVVRRCNLATSDFDPAGCGTGVSGSVTAGEYNYLDFESPDASYLDFKPNSLLTRNYWYEVTLIAGQIFGANGVSLAGNTASQDYRWVFKTRDSDELSRIACAYVDPASNTSYFYNDQKNWTGSVQAQDFACVNLNPSTSCNLGWDWNTGGDIRAELESPGNDENAVSTALIETIPDPPVDIVAQCNFTDGSVEGQGRLTIDFSNPYITNRFPNCGGACLNARVGATFSKAMNLASIQSGVKLYTCYDNVNCPVGSYEMISTFSPPQLEPLEAPNTYIGDVACFDINGDGISDYCLFPNTYYRVIIKDVFSDAENKELKGLNFDSDSDGAFDSYSWVFKSRKEFGLCLPEIIDVIPAEEHANIDNEILYGSRPRTGPDICDPEFGQRLSPGNWQWAWSSEEASGWDGPLCSGTPAATPPPPNALGYYSADLLSKDEPAQNYCDIGGAGLRNLCGNRVINIGEDCDDGNLANGDGCSDVCLTENDPDAGNTDYDLEICGNRVIESSEMCDGGLGCSASCVYTGSVIGSSICGDGFVGAGEECDEGELLSGFLPTNGDFDSDGISCGSSCRVLNRDSGFCRSNATNIFDFSLGSCSGQSQCASGQSCVLLSGVSGNANTGASCGNGIIEAGEECDPAGNPEPNNDLSDGCTNECLHTGWNAAISASDYVGNYQIAKALADGEAYIQSWLDDNNLTPSDGGPLGQGHLTVGSGLGDDGIFRIIKRWPDCGSACINADIGARFNQEADSATLTADNILFYDCGADENCLVGANDPRSLSISIDKDDNQSSYFRIILPNQLLLPNTTYRVVVKAGVTSFDELLPLAELNYDYSGNGSLDSHSWKFTTRPDFELCQIERIEVEPDGLTLDQGQRQRYLANPYSGPDSCEAGGQRLGAHYYSWNWEVVDVDGIDAANLEQPVDSDPRQFVVTQTGLPGFDLISEEVKAWTNLYPGIIGSADLFVRPGARVDFEVIGRQPAVGAENQCRNVAVWAVFSKELNQETIGDTFRLTDAEGNSLITSYSYRTFQGQCINSSCQHALADEPWGTCQANADCVGSQLSVAGLDIPTGFLDSDSRYTVNVSAIQSKDGLTPICGPGRECSWDFNTADNFCQCDYVGVIIDPTSAQSLTTKDLFTCAGDSCGDSTPLNPLDDDAELDLPGNQHLYQATCYDINNPTGSRIPISDSGIAYEWSEVDPDNIIYLSEDDTGSPWCDQDQDSLCFVTPGAESGVFPDINQSPAGKNGNAEVKIIGNQYVCSNSGAFCLPGSSLPAGCGSCLDEFAADRFIQVTNFICDNPWPGVDNLFYQDNEDNSVLPDTNFRFFYCRDFGAAGFEDDLPALEFPGLAVIGQGSVLKEFVFPVAGESGSALGLRVLKNPLRLSPQTWFQSGLCGGIQNFDNICFSDTDCNLNNIFPNGNFEQFGPLSPISCNNNTGDNNFGLFCNPSGPGGVSATLEYTTQAARNNGLGARLNVAAPSSSSYGAQIVSSGPERYTLSPGSYSFSAYVRSDKQVTMAAQLDTAPWLNLCENANCQFGESAGPAVCNTGLRDSAGNPLWEKLTCNFSLSEITNVQFFVRLNQTGFVDIDDMQLNTNSCQFNVPIPGNPQNISVDNYQAIRDGRSVYAGATNLSANNLFSNVYLISYDQPQGGSAQAIFDRVLDQSGQLGSWEFNTNIGNHRICNSVGFFAGTENICSSIGSSNFNDCSLNADQASCQASAKNKGCYWSSEANGCLARICQPIYCENNFQCPDLNCNANKEKVVRDAERAGDLADIKISLDNYSKINSGYPALAGGTYIPETSFSVWPSWQQTLGNQLGSGLFADPINRFIGCSAYYCDSNGNGVIDPSEANGSNSCPLGELTSCGNEPHRCLAVDPDEEATCWDEISKSFSCPADMLVYGYRSFDSGSDFDLYAKFEYDQTGSWRTRDGSEILPFYELPPSQNPSCQILNFEISDAKVFSSLAVAPNCSDKRCYGPGNNPDQSCNTVADCAYSGPGALCSGDADSDGICDSDNRDNCSPRFECPNNPANCYNPDQRDSDGNGLGDSCDPNCSGDTDADGICNQFDNCANVFNPDQKDSDGDGIGDSCDPCTDLDGDGWWDIDTGANDPAICPAPDNCSPYLNGFCRDSAGATNNQRCHSVSDCSPDFNASCGIPFSGAGVSADRRSYCSSNGGATPLPIVCTDDYKVVCPAGETCCPSPGQTCQQFTDNKFKYYNPFQEDFDDDLAGYICDSCIDFDGDSFGDYPFYTGNASPASAGSLTAQQKQHFEGCRPSLIAFGGFVSPPNPTIDLDNCPAGPNGAACRDQFGIAISCYNPLQEDSNQNNIGNICEGATQACGNGIVDFGELCDCGSANVSSSGSNPFTCSSLNNQPCDPSYGESCDYCSSCNLRETVFGGECGDGIAQWPNEDSHPEFNEECDDGNNIDNDFCANSCRVNIGGDPCLAVGGYQNSAINFLPDGIFSAGDLTANFSLNQNCSAIRDNQIPVSLELGGSIDPSTGQPSPYTPSQTAIVFVSDLSGSMNWCLDGSHNLFNNNCPQGVNNSRITALKTALISAINTFAGSVAADYIRIGLVSYSNDASDDVVSGGNCPIGGGSVCSINNPQNINFLLDIINGYEASGNTNIAAGVNKGGEILYFRTPPDSNLNMVLMTDGNPTQSGDGCQDPSSVPNSCHITASCSSCCGFLSFFSDVNWTCSGITDAATLKTNGVVTIYGVAFGADADQNEVNAISSNNGAGTCGSGYCYTDSSNLSSLYDGVVTDIIDGLGQRFRVTVDGGALTQISLPFTTDSNPTYQRNINLPANFCGDADGNHGFAVSNELNSGTSVIFSGATISYCPSCDVDGDGFYAVWCGGPDCDDNNNSISPKIAENCTDGIDNDCDGNIDRLDVDCNAGREICSVIGDEDGNSLADCFDPACGGELGPGGVLCCSSTSDCTGAGVCKTCNNDSRICVNFSGEDGLNCSGDCTYCSSGSCLNRPVSDGTECSASQTCQFISGSLQCAPQGANESGPAQCFDGLDNDLDGLVDCADPGCAGVQQQLDSGGVGAVCCQTAGNCGVLGACYDCSANNTCSPYTGENALYGNTCDEVCTRCSAGSCVNRNPGDGLECPAGQGCNVSGPTGICVPLSADLVVYYLNQDGDGYYDENAQSCSGAGCQPAGSTLNAGLATDCNDNDDSINPDAAEICGNGIDEDCDGQDLACFICGDNVCESPAENCGNCATDCGCGIGQICDPGTFVCVPSGGLDTTSPTVNITSPTSAASFVISSQPLTTLAGTASDNVGVTLVTWDSDRDSLPAQNAIGTASWSVSGIPLQSGSNVITVRAFDAAGNQGTDVLTITYNIPDTTVPVTTANPLGGAYNSAQQVSLTANEPAAIRYCVGSSCTPNLVYSSPINISSSSILRFQATDIAGNIETIKQESYTLNIDTTAPVTTANPSGGTYISAQSVTLTANEAVQYTRYCLGSGCSPNLTYSSAINISSPTILRFYSVDNAGNVEAFKQEVYTIDILAPETSASPPGGAYNSVQQVSLVSNEPATIRYCTGSGCTPNSVYSSPININVSSVLRFQATDTAGNVEATKQENYTIDTTAPTTTANPAGGAYNSAQPVSLIANEPATIRYCFGSGCNPVNIYSSTLDISGTTILRFRATDTAGNVEATKQENYTIDIDTTAPTTTANPAGGAYNSSQPVSLTANEPATIRYCFGSGCNPSTVYSSAINISSSSILRFRATDTAGNVEATKQENYTIDTTAPTTTANPAGGAYNSAQQVSLVSNEPATIRYCVGSSCTPNLVYSSPINISSSSILRFRATDTAGNVEATKQENYTIDTTAPTTTANPPGGAYNSVQPVSLIANEPATIRYCLGSGCGPSLIYSSQISISSSSVLRFFATDTLGNAEQIKEESYVISCPSGDADRDGICDSVDVCPYDPDNDFDNDGFCAVGCIDSGQTSSRFGTKGNGWLCEDSNQFLWRDNCTNGTNQDDDKDGIPDNCKTNSCRVVFGAYDYFNVYINGKLITGNLFPPHDPLFNPPVGIIDNVFFNIDRHLVSGENVIAIEALTYTVSRTVLGAFADVLDAGLCSNLGPSSVNKKTDSVSHLGGDMSQALPVKCFVDKDNAATYPADFFDCSGGTCWRESDFDDSGAGWTFSVNGSLPLGGDPGEPLSDRIVRGGNYSNPFPIWGGDKNFNNTSHIYCRYVFTR